MNSILLVKLDEGDKEEYTFTLHIIRETALYMNSLLEIRTRT